MASRDRKNEKLITSKKLADTRRDVEHLQNELQKLIEAGLQNTNAANKIINNIPSTGEKSNENKVQIIKSYELQPGPSAVPDSAKSKSPTVQTCTRKERDNKEIQDYIKKQREKFKENLKNEKKSNKNEREIRKQKLQELQAKSRDLVAKNVQASRARSKSRDNGNYLRIDKAQRSRSASCDRNHVNLEEKDYLKPPLDNHVEKSFFVSQNDAVPSKISRSRNITKKSYSNINPDRKLSKNTLQIPNSSSNNVKSPSSVKSLKTVNSKEELVALDSKKAVNTEAKSKSSSKKPHHSKITYLRRHSTDETNFSPTELDKGFIGDDVEEPKLNSVNSKSISLQNHDLQEKSNKSSTKSTSSIKKPDNVDNIEKYIENRDKINGNNIKNSNNVDNLEEYFQKNSQPIQNHENTNWLRLTAPQPYPYNFINTAKRKLQYAISTDQKTAEKSIQNPSNELPPRTPENNPKTRQEIMEMIQKSIQKTPVLAKNDALSFASHKRLNLDPKPLEQLSLNKNRRHSEEDDSDTSKNIPEISSESCTSLKRNAESVKHLNNTNSKVISTDKLDNMRLSPKKSSKGSQSSIFTEIASDHSARNSRKSKSSEDLKKSASASYSSDFVSNKSFELPKTASRDSIISHYSCDYSKSSSKNSAKHSSTVSSLSSQSKHSNFTVIEENIPATAHSNSKSLKPKSSVSSSSQKQSESEEDIKTVDNASSQSKTQRKNSIVEDMVSHFEALSKKFSGSSSSVQSMDRESDQVSSSAESVASSSSKSVTRKSNHAKLKKPSLSLQAPSVSLQSAKTNKMKNICIRRPVNVDDSNGTKSNEIHLKFEAEIHLLNDFNESLRQLSAVEEAFESLKMKNLSQTKILENRDTQTSIQANNNDSYNNKSNISEHSRLSNGKSKQSSLATINFSRGSEVFETDTAEDTFNYFSTTTLEASNLNSTVSEESAFIDTNQTVAVLDESTIQNQNIDILNTNPSKVANLSLAMFQQLIKDEDVRLENLKTILKIRERALLDRTNGALAYLQIQKKQLKETGKLDEVTLIRKKQRGILMKTHQERQEMRRLKAMQKAASTERKLLLKEQLKVIKLQLHTENMLSKVKDATPRSSSERRTSSGPLKVIQSESIRSETSMSRKSSIGEEVLSISSHSHSVVNKITELDKSIDITTPNGSGKKKLTSKSLANLHRSLLMREAALHKRRKTAEELLQWHQRLLDEEKRIKELEESANKIISQQPSKEHETAKYNFTGKQLNNLWEKLTGSKDRRFAEDKVFPMSQLALERFCKSAKEYCSKSQVFKRASGDNSSNYGKTDSFSELSDFFSPPADTAHSSSIETAVEDAKSTPNQVETEYTADFESISNQNEEKAAEESQLSAINKLIDNFSQVHDNISLISQVSKKSLENVDHLKSQSEIKTVSANIQTEKEVETEVTQKDDEQVETIDKDSTDIEEDLSVDNEFSKSEEINSVIASQKVSDDTEKVSKEQSNLPNAEEEPEIKEDLEKSESVPDQSVDEKLEITEKSAPTSNDFSYGIIEKQTKDSPVSSPSPSEDISKSVESVNNKSSQKTSISSDVSNSAISSSEISSGSVSEKKTKLDVKKRVLEIMADAASPNRGDKSPRLQDLYVTTYDVISPPISPEGSPHQRSQVDGSSPRSPAKKSTFGSEAEELRRKQLAIEQEIKQLEQQQQQKEQLPYVFMREIPNKPPPPYTPPAALPTLHSTILPKTADEIDEITKYSSKILHKAYLSRNLENISISDNTLNLVLTNKEISKDCYKFVFDLCKEIAFNHYKEFEEGSGPAWLKVPRKPQLAHIKPLDSVGLEKLMSKKLKEMFGFSKSEIRENAIIKWSRKKRDHVDEILVMESQLEEGEWLDYDKDEKVLLDKVTKDIMKSLLAETANIFNSILNKRNSCN